MNHIIKRKENVKRQLDELRNNPAAKREDRREWIALSEPVFAELVRIDKTIDVERSMLADFAKTALSESIRLCNAGEKAQASALATIVLEVISGMYSQQGVILEHVRNMIIDYKSRFPGAGGSLESMERKLEDAKTLETEFTGTNF